MGTNVLGPQKKMIGGMRSRYGDQTLAAWLILPSILVIGGLLIYPLLYNIFISLHDFDLKRLYLGTPFIGLKNYISALTSNYFWSAVGRTLYFTIASVGIELILGIMIALVLNRDFWGRDFVRSILLLPWAIPTVVNGIMWKWIYNSNYGALNGILKQLGLIHSYQNWLGHPITAMNMVILADVWKTTPFVAIMILAALQTIPDSLYEAAQIDGAGPWQAFQHLTLRLIRPSILVVLVIRTMEAFRVFDIIYIITRGGPADGTQVITYFTYNETFNNLNFGLGASLAYLTSLVILVMALIYMKLLRSESNY